MKRLLAAVAAFFVASGLVRLRWLTGMGWGTEGIDRHRRLPGDDEVLWADEELTHAVHIDAPREDVWPWIVQMGVKRAGWYTPEWVDRYLWRVDNVSLDYVDPDLQQLEAGQMILDGPLGTAEFTVVEVDPPNALVLRSQRHPVTGIPPNLESDNPGPYLDFSWAFVLSDEAPDRTLLMIRTRGVARLPWIARRMAWLVWPMLDYAMARWMLLGIKQRVESVQRVRRAAGGN